MQQKNEAPIGLMTREILNQIMNGPAMSETRALQAEKELELFQQSILQWGMSFCRDDMRAEEVARMGFDGLVSRYNGQFESMFQTEGEVITFHCVDTDATSLLYMHLRNTKGRESLNGKTERTVYGERESKVWRNFRDPHTYITPQNGEWALIVCAAYVMSSVFSDESKAELKPGERHLFETSAGYYRAYMVPMLKQYGLPIWSEEQLSL